ncbi:MAG: 5-(carboxyamino)imidazole ribonucleotide mutase [Acidobacteria bacterium]|nr:5-(carboxyamino)imidazole ribonucleotide mutase [Acidobacteriota bacterium]
MAEPRVGILMGSANDMDVMRECTDMLKKLGIAFEVEVASAHRTPDRTARYAESARSRGLRVLVAGAGAAAHLAGVVAAHTTLPVLGVPIDSSPLKGLDALLSTAQMPGGVPVAAMAIGKAGARNAAIFAAQVLATADPEVALRLHTLRDEMREAVDKQSAQLKAEFPG